MSTSREPLELALGVVGRKHSVNQAALLIDLLTAVALVIASLRDTNSLSISGVSEGGNIDAVDDSCIIAILFLECRGCALICATVSVLEQNIIGAVINGSGVFCSDAYPVQAKDTLVLEDLEVGVVSSSGLVVAAILSVLGCVSLKNVVSSGRELAVIYMSNAGNVIVK